MDSTLSDTSRLFGQLIPHGGAETSIAQQNVQIGYEISRSVQSAIDVQFTLNGPIETFSLPQWSRAIRADGLWNHSCFEVFIGPIGLPAYCEFNFAPTGGWAAYQFARYRDGMQNLSGVGNPQIETQITSESYKLRARVSLGGANALSAEHDWRLGVSAIIEDKCGAKTYWALAHPPGKADFHHDDCFTETLKRPESL